MSLPEDKKSGSYLGAVVFGVLFVSILFWLLVQYGRKEPPQTAVSLLPPVSSTTAAALGGSSISKAGSAIVAAVQKSFLAGGSESRSEIINLPSSVETRQIQDEGPIRFTAAGCAFDHAALPARRIIMNEIAWMGSPRKGSESATASGNNEWIELRSMSSGTISLSGWRLQDSQDKFSVDMDGFSIKAGQLSVLERTDDDSSPASAAFIYSGALSNDGLHLHLYDEKCVLQDDIDASAGWPAGNAKERMTLERDRDGVGWHTSQIVGGTPGKSNTSVSVDDKKISNSFASVSQGVASNNATPATQSSASGSQQSSAANASTLSEQNNEQEEIQYAPIKISEVQIEDTDNTHAEFVELHNPTNSSVSLSGWYVQRKTRSGNWSAYAPKSVLEGVNIAAHGYVTIAIADSPIQHDINVSYGITADNSLVVKNPDGGVVDMLGWGEASGCEGGCASAPASGHSISRNIITDVMQDTDNNALDFVVCANPTPKSPQTTCQSPTSIIAQVPIETIQPEPTPVVTSTIPATSTNTLAPVVFSVLLYEVRTSGGEGKTSEDYIALFNSGPDLADVSGWKLRKRTSSGSESSIKVLPEGASIAVGGVYVWANSSNNYAAIINANTSSTATLADNNSIALLDGSGNVIDQLAWGSSTNPFVEGVAISNIPALQIARRIELGGVVQDTQNNSADFMIR